MKLHLLPYQQFLLISSKFSAFIICPLSHLLYCDVFMLHVVLQKRSPNACPIPKVKVKSSPMIEKLQVGPGRTHILPQQIKTGWHWSWSQLLCGRAATGEGDAGAGGDSQVNRAVTSLVRGPSPTIH